MLNDFADDLATGMQVILVYLRHFVSVWKHKYFVFRAGRKLRVPIWRLIIHDWTKFTPAEFGRYARYSELRRVQRFNEPVGFIFGSASQVQYDFSLAWLNHENRNPHHWGYWIPRSGAWTGRPLPMPETYVREMVADWHGASRTYEGHWDISEWVEKNLPNYNLHPETAQLVHEILVKAGYSRHLPMNREISEWGYTLAFPHIWGSRFWGIRDE